MLSMVLFNHIRSSVIFEPRTFITFSRLSEEVPTIPFIPSMILLVQNDESIVKERSKSLSKTGKESIV